MGGPGNLDQLADEADAARITLRTAARADLTRAIQTGADELLATIDAATQAGDVDNAVAVLCGFFVPLIESEQAAKAERLLVTLLSRTAELDDPERLFQLHELACTEAFLKGEAEADDHCRELFVVATSTASEDLLARALTARCRLGLRDEDGASVEADATALAELGARLGDSFHAAFAPHMLANLREMQDKPAEAIGLYTESSRLFTQAGADHQLLSEAFNLAACYLDLGRLASARRRFVQTHELMGRLENKHLEPELLSCMATLLADEGEPDTAARLVGASDAAQQRHGRGLYPAEAKFAERTQLRLEQELGPECFDEYRRDGLTKTFDQAADLAGLTQTPAQ